MSLQHVIKTCQVHGKKRLTVYCYDCQRPVCFQCSRAEHASHNCDSLADAAVETRLQIPNECVQLKSFVQQTFQHHNSRITKVHRSNLLVCEKYAQDAEKLKDSFLDVVKFEIKKEIEKQVCDLKSNSTELERMKTQSEDVQKDLEKSIDELDSSRMEYSEFEVLEMKKEVQDKVKALELPEPLDHILKPRLPLLVTVPESVVQEIRVLTKRLWSCHEMGLQLEGKEDRPCASDLSQRRISVPNHVNRLFVAAIYVGSSHSCYAFSSKDSWRKLVMNNWTDGKVTSVKVKTSLLLNSRKELVEFGFGAERKYSEMKNDGSTQGHFLFTKIGLLQGSKPVIKDVEGKLEMSFFTIWTIIVRYLTESLMSHLKKIPSVLLGDVEFVMLLPPNCSEHSSEKIRVATLNAINADGVFLIHESEAAVICYQHHGDAPLKTSDECILMADYDQSARACFLKRSNDAYIESIPSFSGECAANDMCKLFHAFLGDLFEKSTIEEFENGFIDEFNSIMQDFRTKVRNLNYSLDTAVTTLTLPTSLLALLPKKWNKVEDAIAGSRFAHLASFISGKLRWKNKDFVTSFLYTTVSKSVQFLSKTLNTPSGEQTNTVLLTGELSECRYFQEELRQKFTNKTFLVLSDPDLTILRGAVYAGYLYGRV